MIEELGIVCSLDRSDAISKLQVLAPQIAQTTQVGQSICVNGICLTVVAIERQLLCFEVMPETIKRTNLSLLKKTDKVNLEQALRSDGRIDGHFVTGHIDGTGTISKREIKSADTIMTVKSAPHLLRYIVLKGSLALDGVSLTVSAQKEGTDSFCVNLIPYTLKNTTLGFKQEADLVNIECDILAKYTESSLSKGAASPITRSFLREHGFVA